VKACFLQMHWSCHSIKWQRAVTGAKRFCESRLRRILFAGVSSGAWPHRLAGRVKDAGLVCHLRQTTAGYFRVRRWTRRTLESVGEDFSWATSRRHLSSNRFSGRSHRAGCRATELSASVRFAAQNDRGLRSSQRAAAPRRLSGSRGIDSIVSVVRTKLLVGLTGHPSG
jgi:hypothetical protein